ncbi:PREDICTED: natterin-3-like [Thamnophis sirtalis]|uniref:Natterin-3-like n=1 Tax=Thamnophis sirtalis TaxID=35019 RepID=A0A6I9XCK3_9SAUR|nr:PREDICTED: natterin-3-like [Thamnophis sirtalis]
MCRLLSALFLFLIISESMANDVKISFKVLNRTMEKNIPQIKPGNAISRSAAMKEKQPSSRSVGVFHETTMRWAWFPGYVPNGAVYYWNSYANRYEYPCKVSDCSAGYYSSSRGPYCYYPYGNKELSTSQFYILVNDHGFESLIWQYGSWGNVPSNSINTCSGDRVYVGRNKYGLGKVVSKHQAFFVVINGKEKDYKEYDVLTINKNYQSQSISNVNYDLNKGSYTEAGMALASSKLINKDCRAVKKSTTLSGTVTSDHSWEVDMSIAQTLSFGMTAGIPDIIGGSWGISSEKTFSWRKGYTYSESVTFSETIEVEIPPNHSCELVMDGKKMRGQVPFTATATRYYRDGTWRSATIQGVSSNVVGLKGAAQVERCVPIPDAVPCTA